MFSKASKKKSKLVWNRPLVTNFRRYTTFDDDDEPISENIIRHPLYQESHTYNTRTSMYDYDFYDTGPIYANTVIMNDIIEEDEEEEETIFENYSSRYEDLQIYSNLIPRIEREEDDLPIYENFINVQHNSV
ncbi:hypothetical protein PVAND_001750 [Polypedilum vanderplanki]|uniref:Uncharacterized protein n=1 Tax=Polypedilum vanderplanki TaxID=319348 RepID=A0A9J6BPC4_POLVA|nr:hypothetical protein PVAND_001750 [Polypedilum vanderplanki]